MGVFLYFVLASICLIFVDDNIKKRCVRSTCFGDAFVLLIFSPILLIFSALHKLFKIFMKRHEFDNKWEGLFNVKNFIRPCYYRNVKKLILANKFCVLAFDESWKSCTLFNKIDNTSSFFTIDVTRYTEFLKKACEDFDFNTTAEDILNKTISNFILQYSDSIFFQNQTRDKTDFSQISLNNMSVAELMQLPGINLGKANKIEKYLKNSTFVAFKPFAVYANITDADAKELEKLFKDKLTCDIKQLMITQK